MNLFVVILFALNECPWIYSEHNERGSVYRFFLLCGTVFGLLISPDSLKVLLFPASGELQNSATEVSLLLHTLKSEMVRFARVIFFFFNRDVGSINNFIDSPGAKLLEDRKQANLNVTSQACHPQTSLRVSSCNAQYNLAKKKNKN